MRRGPRAAASSLLLAAFLIALGNGCGGDDDDDASDADVNDDAADDDSFSVDEPPVNPYLADSPWPMAHRNPYCQGSTPLPGPEADDALIVDHLRTSLVPAFMLYGPADAAGRRAVWTTSLLDVYTIDAQETPLRILSEFHKIREPGYPLAGEYTILDHEGTFWAPQASRLHAFAHENPAAYDSPIVENGVFPIPGALPGEAILGINMTYDGMIVLATTSGRIGVVSRDFTLSRFVQLGGDEDLHNSIAVDEDGGIYVVTTERMYRVQWTGQELSLDESTGAWSAPYERGPGTLQPGRISVGSGTTPTLMGSGDGDKFVVICDGQEVMRIVLFWRDRIPNDWQPLAPGKDRRIAAEVPVDFGDPAASFTSTEQSVLVRGYDAAVVNNYYGPDAPTGVLAALVSNLPAFAPYGAQKFRWDPVARRLDTVWTNPTVSCPNSVPTMSAASGLMYCIGQRNSIWTLEAIDWETGRSAFFVTLGEGLLYNSYYAATEIGPARNIINGSLLGVIDIRPR